jgi:hypothetical protein
LRHKGTFKLVHLLPACFVLFQLVVVIAAILFTPLALLLFGLISLVYFTDSLIKNKSIKVALLSVVSSFGQMNGYGSGFIISFWRRIILRKPEFHAFKKNFYK